MSSSSLVRWSGLVAMVAGVLLLIAELLELLPVFDDIPFSELALTRACRHLSQARAQTRWRPARKFLAVFS
jgi:hypothetical protein